MPWSNRWNRIVYALWAPVYDLLSDRLLSSGRRRAMEILDAQVGERILLVGVGTGADLPLLPPHTSGCGLDISRAMLAKASARLPLAHRQIDLLIADAERLPLRNACCDAAVLHLILSVVPDGRRCLEETLRALRPGGRIIIFDKFLADFHRPSLLRRALGCLVMVFGTDVNRQLSDLTAGLPCSVLVNEPSLFGGAYRLILLRKTAD